MPEYVLLGSARREYDDLSPAEQAEVDAIIRLLELDPWVDNVRKFALGTPGMQFTLYEDMRWQILYRVIDSEAVEIYIIERVTI